MKEEVHKLNAAKELIVPQMDQLNDEIKYVKELIENSKIDMLINGQELSKILEEESLKLFGNSNKYKKNIHEIKSRINLLKSKTKEVEMNEN